MAIKSDIYIYLLYFFFKLIQEQPVLVVAKNTLHNIIFVRILVN